MTKIRNTIAKQKNVSMDIKNGRMEVEEAINVIIFSKTSWKKAGEEMQKNISQETLAAISIPGIEKLATSNWINLDKDGKLGGNPANGAGPAKCRKDSQWTKNLHSRRSEAHKARTAAKATEKNSCTMYKVSFINLGHLD